MKALSAPTRNKATLSVATNESTHEYHQTPRPPFKAMRCICGTTSTIDGEVPVDLFDISGLGARDQRPMCLGCLATSREYGLKCKRVQA